MRILNHIIHIKCEGQFTFKIMDIVEASPMSSQDPFVGHWKLNVQRSQFDPNHRPSNGTMHWELASEGYRTTAQGTMGDGRIVEERPTNFILDGKEHPITESPGCSAIMSRITPNTIEAESRNAGHRVGKASYVVSEDGATLIASVSGLDMQQRNFQAILVWDRLWSQKMPAGQSNPSADR
jgi:hypothetical protein